MKKSAQLLKLFTVFFKIGAFTFGGGYAMIPLIKAEAVEKNNWIGEDDLLDIIAVAESTPGPIAVNASTFVGKRVAGFFGALTATFALVLPPFCVMLAVSSLLIAFKDVKVLRFAFEGVRAGVLALLIRALWLMYKQSPKGIFAYAVMAAAFAATAFFKINILPVVVLCAAAGLIYSLLAKKEEKK